LGSGGIPKYRESGVCSPRIPGSAGNSLCGGGPPCGIWGSDGSTGGITRIGGACVGTGVSEAPTESGCGVRIPIFGTPVSRDFGVGGKFGKPLDGLDNLRTPPLSQS